MIKKENFGFSLLILLFTLFSTQQATAQEDDISLGSFKWRSVGPAVTSGRIADIAVDPTDFNTYYIATASSGVWKTTNNATTWDPLFDGEGSFSIGCVAINPHNRHEVWVGTGENNNQRSVGYGDGLYKSSDGGKSWTKMGLEKSEHIGMIAFHPNDPFTVYVAAYGPLWNAGGDRGIYKSTDGGKSWNKVAEVDENTGFNEVHYHPLSPGLMFATAHQRRRHVWTHLSGGPGSGLYRSIDDGETWEEVKSGIPSADKGRMSLTISPADPDRLYLMIEGHGTYVSSDRGASWSKKSGHYTSGNYYVELIAHPTNKDIVYSMDTYAHVSIDGGNNFKRVSEKFKHVDNHCIWINPVDPDHMRMGCDGGFYQTYDGMKTWWFSANLPITQFYRVSTDNAEPFYNIYGGTQDNFSLKGPSRTTSNHGIVNSDWSVTNTGDGFETQVDPTDPNTVYAQAQYGWLVRFDAATGESVSIKPIEGKDEKAWRWNWDAPLLISPHNPSRLYFCANIVFRSDDKGQSWTRLSEDLSRGEDRNTYKIMGEHWSIDAIARHKSTSIYGNIVSFNESPIKEGLLFAGTDDGLIHIKQADSDEWKKYEEFGEVPPRTYVQGIWPSSHDEDVVFAAFNNHKEGDFKPYLLKSTNGGKSWKPITNGIPERGTIYAFAQDHVNPDLMFVGTEFGFYTSVDGGANWKKMKSGLPTVAVKDIEIQKRENDLVIATFGRGFYVLDDYSPLREVAELNQSEGYVFSVMEGLLYQESTPLGYSGGGFQGAGYYRTENPDPGVVFTYFLNDVPKTYKAKRKEQDKQLKKDGQPIIDPSSEQLTKEELEEAPYVLLVIKDSKGAFEIIRKQISASKGISRVHWDGRFTQSGGFKEGDNRSLYSASFVAPGTYTAEMYLIHDTIRIPIGKPTQFALRHLGGATMPAEKPAELITFQRFADKLDARLDLARAQMNQLRKDAAKMHDASRIVLGIPQEMVAESQLLIKDLESMKLEINGDSRVSALEKETTPGLSSRLGSVIWNSYYSSSSPTQMQKDQVKIVEEALYDLENRLIKLSTSSNQLYTKLVQAGMPAFPKSANN